MYPPEVSLGPALLVVVGSSCAIPPRVVPPLCVGGSGHSASTLVTPLPIGDTLGVEIGTVGEIGTLGIESVGPVAVTLGSVLSTVAEATPISGFVGFCPTGQGITGSISQGITTVGPIQAALGEAGFAGIGTRGAGIGESTVAEATAVGRDPTGHGITSSTSQGITTVGPIQAALGEAGLAGIGTRGAWTGESKEAEAIFAWIVGPDPTGQGITGSTFQGVTTVGPIQATLGEAGLAGIGTRGAGTGESNEAEAISAWIVGPDPTGQGITGSTFQGVTTVDPIQTALG